MNWLQELKNFCEIAFNQAESGHDYAHALRVLKNGERLLKNYSHANERITLAACLCHDLLDHKFDTNGNEELLKERLNRLSFSSDEIDSILHISKNISFSKASKTEKTIEFQIVQDADRLDAIGAIGIARTFNYGGFKNRSFYQLDKETPIIPELNQEQYSSATVDHFYEKLLLLKDLMNTETAKEIAQQRHSFMLLFLEHFENEVKNGG